MPDPVHFAGLTVEPGTALVDTGAQVPLIGEPALEALDDRLLETIGKKSTWLDRVSSSTGGVGGKANIVGTVEIPIGIAGSSGIIKMKVTKEDIPPLLPGGFYRKMGMIADYPNQTLTWAALGNRQSRMIQLPSDHIACRIDECPNAKWTDPR